VITAAKALLILHLFTAYIGTIGPTHGISMVPTIPHSYLSTPYILISHLHRRGRNIAVGDVITYHSPAKASMVGCKRVIGMPGDFVSVLSRARDNGDLGKADDEGDWANVKDEVVRVPEGHCWLAGDNLDWSRDSRVFGAVPLNLVRGKVLAVVWPPSAWKTLGGDEGLRDATEEEHEPLVTR
jgi:inner membrane protease subunit 1